MLGFDLPDISELFSTELQTLQDPAFRFHSPGLELIPQPSNTDI